MAPQTLRLNSLALPVTTPMMSLLKNFSIIYNRHNCNDHETREVLVLGDFNVHSWYWLGSSKRDLQERATEIFAVTKDSTSIFQEIDEVSKVCFYQYATYTSM